MKPEIAEFQERVHELHDELLDSEYDGRQDDVRRLIDEARKLLIEPGTRKLGSWEDFELDHATAAANANFLRLALVSINKAIVVGELPKEEYDYGFNYGRR